jgi:hypothetical protein
VGAGPVIGEALSPLLGDMLGTYVGNELGLQLGDEFGKLLGEPLLGVGEGTILGEVLGVKQYWVRCSVSN